MHALIATDGSDVSLDATRRGCALLQIDEVTLLNVLTHETPAGDAAGVEGPVFTPEDLRRWWQREFSDAYVRLARTERELADVPVREVIQEGEAAAAICKEAEARSADVIVVGSHGRTGVKRWFLGSVSERVVRHAPCPVLVIHSEES